MRGTVGSIIKGQDEVRAEAGEGGLTGNVKNFKG